MKQKGFVIKSAYSTIKTIKKRFVAETVDALLDDWLGKLQPHYDKWETAKAELVRGLRDRAQRRCRRGSAEGHRRARREDVAHDREEDVRPDARLGEANVVEAIPDLARLLEKHLDGALEARRRRRRAYCWSSR